MHRAGVFWFAGLLLLAVPAFWPTYLFPPKYETDWHVHLHAVAMVAWMLLLVAQAGLIRAARRDLHRRLGKVSYALVPLMVASTLLMAHYRLKQTVNVEVLYFFYVQLSLIAVFAFSWALAIVHRRQPVLHMRYMVCAALTLVDPIVARILFNALDVNFPAMQAITYALADLILVALIWNDRRRVGQTPVYPGMLAVFVITQIPTFFLYKLPAWEAFARAYASLPLP